MIFSILSSPIVTLNQVGLFSIAAMVVVLSPGPDSLATLSVGLSHGRKAAAGFAFGCTMGCLTHVVLAATGIALMLRESPHAFAMLKISGASYLAYLGISSLRARSRFSTASSSCESPLTLRRNLVRGFAAASLNPKLALFFAAFLPQFVRASQPYPTVQLIALGCIFAIITCIWFSSVAACADLIGRCLRRNPRLISGMNLMTGVLFVFLSAALLLQH